jgi:hypothetical protein
MNNIQYKTHEFYARALLDPSRGFSINPEKNLKISEEVEKVRGFIPALASLNELLDKEQSKIDPSLAIKLCHRVVTKEDWTIQKRIYAAVKHQDSDSLLFREMLLKSAEIQDKMSYQVFARTARTDFSKHGEIKQALVISSVRMNDFKNAFFRTKELIEDQQVSTEFIINVVESLPDGQAQSAKNIYRLAIRHGLVSPKLHQVMQRFDPIDDAIARFKKGEGNDQLTAIDFGVLLEEVIQRNDKSLARRIYNDAIFRQKMNPIVWELIIDYETRIVKDLKRAQKLFCASPIEIDLKGGPLGSELDLHGHSYGTACLMVENCIRAYKEDSTHGDQLVVITGIGWKDNKNFLKMQKYVLAWIETHWKNQVKAEVNPQNNGQLIISF